MAVGSYMDDVYMAIAYAEDNQLAQAAQVVHFIAAKGTGYTPPLVLNLEPEGGKTINHWVSPSPTLPSLQLSFRSNSQVSSWGA